MLAEYGCRETILIQVEKRSKKKTDRRDAHQLTACCGSTAHGCWRANASKACVVYSHRRSNRPRIGN
jgi:hypothetical protein